MKNKKNINQVQHAGVLLFTAILLLSLAIPELFAENRDDPHIINDIPGIPEFHASEIDILDIAERTFYLKGDVDAVYKSRIIVGDIEIFINESISLPAVQKGDFVGVTKDKSGQTTGIYKLQRSLFEQQ